MNTRNVKVNAGNHSFQQEVGYHKKFEFKPFSTQADAGRASVRCVGQVKPYDQLERMHNGRNYSS